MSNRSVAQRAAREVQRRKNCPYMFALSIARSEEANAKADEDKSDRPYLDRLIDVVSVKVEDETYADVWGEKAKMRKTRDLGKEIRSWRR